MKKKIWLICMFLLNSFIFSDITLEESKDMIKIKKDALEIVFNKNSSYGIFSIFLGSEKICEIVPSFLKLYPTEEKGKYKTVSYWIPTGQQKLKYFVNKETEKVEIVVLRNFDNDFYIKDYFIVENDNPLLTYISESKKNKDNFAFEYTINFNFKNSDEVVWENNKTSPENLGDYWTKYIEVKNSRWLCGYNKNKSSGVFIIRNFDFDPESAWHHYRLFRGPTLASKITQRNYITRREFNFLIFQNENPEDVAKNLKFKETLPSTYTIENEKKVYPLFLKDMKVDIDGEINEKVWNEVHKESDFYKFFWDKKSYYFPEKQTEFYAFYDKENIYFGVKCYEDDIKNLRYEQKTGSKTLYMDDCIEIFIQPNNSSYFQFIVNPLGEKQDNKGLVEKWEAKGKIFDNFWSVEIKIPFSILGVYPKDKEIWGFNICRERRPVSELSCWNESSGGGGFHQPDKFGQLIFSPTLVPLNITVIESKNTVGLISEIVNFGKEKIAESARISITIPEEKAIEKIYRLTVEKGEKKYLSYAYKGNIQKGYNISFDITSRSGIPYYSKVFQKIGYSGFVSRLWPISYGNKIYIIEDRLQIFPFIFANYTDKEQNFSLILTVPEEINLLYLNRLYNYSYGQFFPLEDVKEEKITKENIAYKKYTIKFSKKISQRNLPSQDEERNYERLILPFYMGKTNLKNLKIFFNIENEEIKEKENIYEVVVVPSFKSKLPKIIETGVFTWYFGSIQDSVKKDEFKKEIASKHALSLKDSGFNTIVYRVSNKEIRDTLNKEGIRIRPSFWWFWWDKEYLEKNPDGYAIDFNGQKAKYGGIDTVCPMLLINDEKVFENTKKIVQNLVTEYGNDIWHDTEGPRSWEICFCERCINEFKKFAKISENEKLDPKIIKLKYRDAWLKFADWQQAVIFSKINKAIKEVNPDAKFSNYGGLSEPEHRCNWEMLSKYNSIDIAGPSMYELTSLTLKYWEKEMEEFKKKVGNLKITPWLNNEARQTNYKLLRTQALKSITIGTDGYHLYYGQLLWRDGRRLYDFGIINTIISDFEEFLTKGEKIKGEIYNDIDKDNYSIDGWQLGDEKVIFIYNHDDKNKKEIKILLPFDLKGNVVFDYMNKEKMQNEKEIELVLDDLDIKVIYIGPEKKLKERLKIWGENKLKFYKE